MTGERDAPDAREGVGGEKAGVGVGVGVGGEAGGAGAARDGVGGAGDGAENVSELAWRGEEALLRSETRHDRVVLEALLAPDFREIGQSGRHWTREQIFDELAAESGESHRFSLDERRVDRLDQNILLLTYRLEFDGRLSRRSSIWRIEGDSVRLACHQGTPVELGDGSGLTGGAI